MSENPASNPVFDRMANHLLESALEVFAEYEIVIQRSATTVSTQSPTESSGVAVIGYAGEGIRGALILAAAESAIRAWMVAVGVADGDVADTLGEFSNMLLGRLKLRLLDEGMTIFAATPTTTLGTGLQLSAPSAQSACYTFDGPGWKVSARLDATFEPGFEQPVFRPICRPVRAGEGIVFDSPFEEV
jgi:CheY-specific phosphatase CheX